MRKVLKECNCLTAGTMIQTDEGEKPIQEIEVGDKILAKSDELGEVEHREVVKLFRKKANQDHFIRHKSILENALGTSTLNIRHTEKHS